MDNNDRTLAKVMETVLSFAPEAVARQGSDGNITISLNMYLTDNDKLTPFQAEYDLTEEDS